MIRHRKPGRKIFGIVSVVIGTFLSVMLLNIIYQAEVLSKNMLLDAYMAVFPVDDKTNTIKNIKLELLKIENISSVKRISRDQALHNAINSSSDIKDVLVSGDNPFLSYFIVNPVSIQAENIDDLKKAVSKINGVDEIRYDPALFSTIANAKIIRHYYTISLLVAFALFALLAMAKIIYDVFRLDVHFIKYLYVVLWGIVLGFIGIALYYLVIYYVLPINILTIPEKYLALVWPVGVFLNILFQD